jgi:hypothetical protein
LSALRLSLAPSPRLAALLLALHGCAAAAVLAVLPDAMGGLLAAAFMALGAAAAWSRALHRSATSVRVLELAGEKAAIELANGARVEATVSPRRHVSRMAVALPLRGAARRTLLITRDMLDPESFRALRVWALWGRTSVAAKQLEA